MHTLKEFGVDYYSYHVANITKTQISTYMGIIKYFLSNRTSKYHDQLIQKFLYRLKYRKLSKSLQCNVNQCLEIMDATSNKTHLTYFYHVLLTCPAHQLIPYCLSNIYNLLDKQLFVNKTVKDIITSHNFIPLELDVHHKRKFIIFFTSILLHHKHSSKVFKALLIMCNDSFISHISMNSC